MPMPPPLPKARRQRAKARSWWKIPAIVLGCVLAIGLGLYGCAQMFELLSTDLPVGESDRSVLVTAEWVSNWFEEEWTPDPSKETVTKRRYIDGSHELEYEYEGDELYIYCVVTIEKTRSDAKASYLAIKAGTSIGASIGEGEMRSRPALLRWGDECSVGLLYYDSDDPSGNYFMGRKGTKIFDLHMSGIYFDEREAFGGFLKPILSALDGYEP